MTWRVIDVDRFCPEGVGVWLADDLARSVSKPCERYTPDSPHHLISLPVPGRSLASQAPTAFGQNQKHAAQQMPTVSARRAWESGLPT
ncbi:MAG TPA: hypothetical protein VN798_09775, partial [Pseudomonas sp.]|nr:hypothetical protein [Pseudomonas sp.]